jgi:hypothetical protein
MDIRRVFFGLTLSLLLGSGITAAPSLYAGSISSMSNHELCKRAAVNNRWTTNRNDAAYIKEALKRKAHCNITTKDRKNFSGHQNATLCGIAWTNGKWDREFTNVIAAANSRGLDCKSFLSNRTSAVKGKKDETLIKCTNIINRNADSNYRFNDRFQFSYTEDGEVPYINGYYLIPKSSSEYKKGRMYSEIFNNYISKVSFVENGKLLTLNFQQDIKMDSGKQILLKNEFIVDKQTSSLKVYIRPSGGYKTQFGTAECTKKLLKR